MKKIIISQYKDRRFCACLTDRKLQYLEFEDDTDHILGCVYLAKVKNVVKNINACFVEYETGKIAFLPFNSIRPETIISQNNNGRVIPVAGDEVLIQIIKAPHKTKDATASGSIRINDRKINLKKHEIYNRAKVSTCFSCIYRPEEFYVNFINKYSKLGFEEIETDLEDIYSDIYKKLGFCEKTILVHDSNNTFNSLDRIDNNLTFVPPIKPRKEKIICSNESGLTLKFNDGQSISLFSIYGLNAALEEVFSKNVWLKCGGYIVIEPTEALVSIDVNSGKAIKKKDSEENILIVNLEAVEEAARQIRLRNLSGMILIDLINMSEEDSYNKVISKLKDELEKDLNKSEFIDITGLGLAEIVRKKTNRPIHELFFDKKLKI